MSRTQPDPLPGAVKGEKTHGRREYLVPKLLWQKGHQLVLGMTLRVSNTGACKQREWGHKEQSKVDHLNHTKLPVRFLHLALGSGAAVLGSYCLHEGLV